MVTVRGDNVRALREHSGAGARTLARALAEARGEAGDKKAIEVARQYLLRLERREGEDDLSEDEAAALADALGVDIANLGSELVWSVGVAEAPIWFGGIVACFSSAETARDFRDHLVMAKVLKRQLTVLPLARSELLRQLAASAPGWNPSGSVVDDPPGDQWRLLVLLMAATMRDLSIPPELVDQLDAAFDLPGRAKQESDRLRMIAAVDPEAAKEWAASLRRLGKYAAQALAQRVDGGLAAAGEEPVDAG